MRLSELIDKKYYLWIILGLLVIIIASMILAYTTNVKFLQKIYPAAIVGDRFVSLLAWQEHRATAAKIDSGYNSQAVFNQLIKVYEEGQLIDSFRIPIAAKDLNQELVFLQTSEGNEYNQLFAKYFANDSDIFNNEFVVPRVYDKLLKIKYNSDFTANSAVFVQAQDILAQIKAGKKFEDLALTDSDDKITGQLGGDLGFVSLNQILPELADKVAGLKVGEVSSQIVVSRLGYHILYPVETSQKDLSAEASAKVGGQTIYHIKQILVQTSGYDNWLNAQLGNFHVWQIVKVK